MSRRTDLEAAVKKQDGAIARLKSVKKPSIEQLRSLVTNLETQNKQLRELATLPPDGPTTPTGPTPPTSGDAVARSKAWNHSEAADNVNAVLERLNDQGVTDLAAQLEALGPGLAGQAIALGKFGSPDHPAGDVDFALAEPWGGYWAVESGFDETGYWAQAWNGSQKAGDRVVDPVSAPDVQEVGMANGLNSRIDGPA